MLEDTWQDDCFDYVENNHLALCSGLTYRGRANALSNARQTNALVFDLDGVELENLRVLFGRFGV